MRRALFAAIVLGGTALLASDASGRAPKTVGARDEEPLVRSRPNLTAVEPLASGPPGPSNSLGFAALDRRVADLDAEEIGAKREIEGLGPKLADVRGRVLLRGRSLYRLTRLGMLPLGGGFEGLVSHAMRVERARRSLHGELANERSLRGRGADLARTLERIAGDKSSLIAQRSAMDAARVASVEESRRREAFERAFESGAGGSEYVAIYGGSGSGNDPVAIGGFSASKGRLLFPVIGRAEIRPAKREAEGGSGLEIRAPLGASVRAVFAGRIAFADRYGSYGRIVILDHGERYYSVSGNLASVDVRIGDEVSAGERIGSVGDEGQGPLVFFELRHGSQTIPAGPWLGVERAR